jgi:hypothetical protein
VRVIFRQSGGFGGLVRGCDLDTEKMPPGEAVKVRALVEKCDLDEGGSLTENARDALVYAITVESGGARRKLLFDDLSMPPSAGPLVEYLVERSSPQGA